MKISFEPIGVVQNEIKSRHDMPLKGVKSKVIISKKYQRALYKISQTKRLWVIGYLHHAENDTLVVKPRKNKRSAQTARGVFVSHSPDRPNPISISKVKLIGRKGLVLEVAGLDVIDGTPVLDIKGA